MTGGRARDRQRSPIVVGYSATATGRDALALGIAMARRQTVSLHLVLVAPEDTGFSPSHGYDRSYDRILGNQLEQWLTDALATVPADVTAHGHVVRATDAAEGLLGAARALDAGLLVIGARSGGLLRSHRLGPMASTLLHAAHVPVALAPTGYSCAGPVGRVTTMFGQRTGTTDLIAVGLETARERKIPLRLVSLVMIDEPDAASTADLADTAAINMSVINGVYSYATDRLAAEAADMVADGTATTVIATGRSVTDALTELDWADDEIVLVASSRLAAHGRLFLGKTATKMMRTTPVPVVVVPAGYTHPAATGATRTDGTDGTTGTTGSEGGR